MSAEETQGIYWCLDSESWLQVGNTFVLASLDDVEPPAALTDLDYLIGAHPRIDGSGFLPRAFLYSPFDGTALKSPKANAWLPPFGTSDGRRICEGSAGRALTSVLQQLISKWQSTSTSMQASAEPVKVPASDGLFFFCTDTGGYRDALFALSRSGSLWLWQRGSQQWLTLQGEPLARHAFDHWATAVVTLSSSRGSEVVIAGDAGADCVLVEPLRLTYGVQRCAGFAAGAPGKLVDAALVPLIVGGVLRVAVRRSGQDWICQDVEGTPAGVDLTERLAAPVTLVNGQALLWVGGRGRLTIHLRGNELSARWQDWPARCIARPVLGPPYRDGSGDWQLLYGSDDGKWRYFLIDARLPTEHLAPRAAAGTGRSNYQFNVPVRRPWEEFDQDLHSIEHALYPFLEIDPSGGLLSLRVSWAQRNLLSFFDSYARVPASYCVEFPGGIRHQYQIEAARPWNAQWFMHDDSLWLWIDERGVLLRWSAP